ncbi:TPA: hypothetical protein ACGOU9_000809 [Streptococcus suis]
MIINWSRLAVLSIYLLLLPVWFLKFRGIYSTKLSMNTTGFTEQIEVENYKKSINRPLDWGLIINGICQVILYFRLDSDLFYVISILIFYVVILMLMFIFIPREQARLKYRYYMFSPDAALRVWNYYAYRNKKLKNIDIWKNNRKSVTYSEINQVNKELKKLDIHKLQNLKLLLGSPKFIDPTEISFMEHMNQFFQIITTLIFSISLPDFWSENGENLGRIVALVMMVWIPMGLLYKLTKNTFSHHQKLKQVEYLLSELIEQIINQE